MRPAVKCKRCGLEIQAEVNKCPVCGAPRPISFKFALYGGILLAGIVLGAVVVKNIDLFATPQPQIKAEAPPQPNVPNEAKESEPVSMEASDASASNIIVEKNWLYSEGTDLKSGKTFYIAATESEMLALPSSYAKEKQFGGIFLGQHPRYGFEAYVLIDNVPTSCEAGNCRLTVQFDEQKPMIFEVGPLADMPADRHYFKKPQAFFSALRMATKVKIEAPLLPENNSAVMVFGVDGLNISRLHLDGS